MEEDKKKEKPEEKEG